MFLTISEKKDKAYHDISNEKQDELSHYLMIQHLWNALLWTVLVEYLTIKFTVVQKLLFLKAHKFLQPRSKTKLLTKNSTLVWVIKYKIFSVKLLVKCFLPNSTFFMQQNIKTLTINITLHSYLCAYFF